MIINTIYLKLYFKMTLCGIQTPEIHVKICWRTILILQRYLFKTAVFHKNSIQ